MNIEFFKYQGTGNDFILIDNREQQVLLTEEQVNFLCNRRFGIGADGLMLLQSRSGYDFEMVYYNSDGKVGSMCGNGGRCIVAFARKLGIIGNETKFIAPDGVHFANILFENDSEMLVQLAMQNVECIRKDEEGFFLDTGSPHYVIFREDIETLDIYNLGKELRHSQKFKETNGTNVNFVEDFGAYLYIRTYERGVEDETYSCGTGVTASAISYAFGKEIHEVAIKTKGGDLNVRFQQMNNQFFDIWLEGKASFVFRGAISLNS